MNKKLLLFMAFVFGLIGAYVPVLWGDNDLLSGGSIIFSLVGGLFGIWLGVVLSKRFG